MSNHVKQRDIKRGGSRCGKVPRYRKTRPKTFKTIEAAKAWAEQNKIKKFELVDMKNDESTSNKIKVVPLA